MKLKLMNMFRHWWNDYLTIEAYASAYGIPKERMTRILCLGRKLHNLNAEKILKRSQYD